MFEKRHDQRTCTREGESAIEYTFEKRQPISIQEITRHTILECNSLSTCSFFLACHSSLQLPLDDLGPDTRSSLQIGEVRQGQPSDRCVERKLPIHDPSLFQAVPHEVALKSQIVRRLHASVCQHKRCMLSESRQRQLTQARDRKIRD